MNRSSLLPAVAGLLVAAPAVAQSVEWVGVWPHMAWGGMMFGGFTMFLFWGAVIALVVMAVRRRHHAETGRHAPLDILRDRFARGEIGVDEYQERKKLLAE